MAAGADGGPVRSLGRRRRSPSAGRTRGAVGARPAQWTRRVRRTAALAALALIGRRGGRRRPRVRDRSLSGAVTRAASELGRPRRRGRHTNTGGSLLQLPLRHESRADLCRVSAGSPGVWCQVAGKLHGNVILQRGALPSKRYIHKHL